MKNYLAHDWAKRQTQKRGGGHVIFSIDEIDAEKRYSLEPIGDSDPERIFDRRWALTVLDRAATALRSEYEASGKSHIYIVLKDFASVEGASVTYEDTARNLQMSVSAVKCAIHRLRRRYQELIRELVAQTVATPSEVNEELRYLLSVISC